MRILGNNVSGQGPDKMTMEFDPGVAYNFTIPQPIAVPSDVPIAAITSGVLISFVLIAVIIYTAICSHRAPRRRLYSVHYHDRQTLGLNRILHEDDHINDYSTVNNGFVGISETYFQNQTHSRGKAFSKPRSDLNPIQEETVVKEGVWHQGNNDWFKAAYDTDSDLSEEDEEARRSEVGGSRRSWRLGSVEMLDVIPEENEDVLTPVNLSLSSSRRLSSPAAPDKQESETESELQFHSCSEGDDLSIDRAAGIQNTVYGCQTGRQNSEFTKPAAHNQNTVYGCPTGYQSSGSELTTTPAAAHNQSTVFGCQTCHPPTSSPAPNQEERQIEETKWLIREAISKFSSDICRMTHTGTPSETEFEVQDGLKVNPSLDRSMSPRLGSTRSPQAPAKPPRKSHIHYVN